MEVAGERLAVLGERALYWPARETLLIADPHFGKAASFRANGIPVPDGTTGGTLARLTSVLAQTAARRLICLGDLLHARAGRSEQTLATITAWREQHPDLDWLLVRGNHDRHAGDPPAAWRVRCVDQPCRQRPFVLRHEPALSDDGYVLAGHVHPAAR
ncbi:MAG: ligase-associated DNA damage response endonuclease PdeM, partial [Anaerolineae bacterium]|nr:ligase-associated DNA damage response endonuclease PdeM [Anaerolineae bacterium]